MTPAARLIIATVNYRRAKRGYRLAEHGQRRNAWLAFRAAAADLLKAGGDYDATE